MGSTYQAICQDCRCAFSFSTGGGFTYYKLLCTHCANTKIAPRRAPSADTKTLSEMQIAEYLSNNRLWTKDGRELNPAERISLQKLLGACECGGTMVPEWDNNAKYRCPNCRSTAILASGGDILTD